MLSTIASFWIAALALGVGESPAVYGPPPSRSAIIGNAAIYAQVGHREGVRIEWPRPFVRGTLSLPGLLPKHGWYTCGFVDELDEKQGTTKRNHFLIMFNRDAVSLLEVGSGEGIDRPTAICTGLAPKDWEGN